MRKHGAEGKSRGEMPGEMTGIAIIGGGVIGSSGHGLMQAPAAGRGLSKLLLHGRYQTLDLSRLGYRRIPDGTPLHDDMPKA
jgi:hypothetical protein